MIYVALLRGINVGGNNKIDMKQLKASFEEAGLKEVSTYINSGNVIFEDKRRGQTSLANLTEAAIEADFNVPIRVLVRDVDSIKATVDAIDPAWVNSADMKCDVLFLWDKVDRPEALDQIDFNPEFEKAFYLPGALVWWTDASYLTRSRRNKLFGTELYKNMTIRNVNTVRKLATLMEARAS